VLGGLVAGGWTASELAVVEGSPSRRDELASAHPGVLVAEAPVAAEGAVLAMKPGDVAEAVRVVAANRILSLAAGVTTRAVERAAGRSIQVVRAMLNTPALVGLGATGISAGSSADTDDMAWAEDILTAVGVVVRVPESLWTR
jgi:pyrroline-5-carboxylate reductase